MIVQPRSGRMAITCADTSRELASFTYEMKSTYSRAIESNVYAETFDWAWQCIPSLISEAGVFSLHVEEALTPIFGEKAEFLPIYAKERMSSMQLVQTLLKKRAKFENGGRPLVPPVRVHPTEHVVNMLRGFMRMPA